MYSEYDAALEWGIDTREWFAQPRIERALKVATVTARRSIHAMQQYDENPPKKLKKQKP